MSWIIRAYNLSLISDFLLTYPIRLLLGVDPERKHVACGLVDTIGRWPN
jgi:hypothetical protein